METMVATGPISSVKALQSRKRVLRGTATENDRQIENYAMLCTAYGFTHLTAQLCVLFDHEKLVASPDCSSFFAAC